MLSSVSVGPETTSVLVRSSAAARTGTELRVPVSPLRAAPPGPPPPRLHLRQARRRLPGPPPPRPPPPKKRWKKGFPPPPPAPPPTALVCWKSWLISCAAPDALAYSRRKDRTSADSARCESRPFTISTMRRMLAAVSVMISELLDWFEVKSASGLTSAARSWWSWVASAWRSGMTCVISWSVGSIFSGSDPM